MLGPTVTANIAPIVDNLSSYSEPMDAEMSPHTATGIGAFVAGGGMPSGGQTRILPQAHAQNRLLSKGGIDMNMNGPGTGMPGAGIPRVVASIGGMNLDGNASSMGVGQGMNMTETGDPGPNTTTLQLVAEGEQFFDEVLADMRRVKVRSLSISSLWPSRM